MSTLTFTVKVSKRKITEAEFEDICQELFDYIVAISPVDTGFFQSQWEMSIDYPTCTFFNDAVYASYLNTGWSSQAPNGITEPAIEHLKTLVNHYT